MEFLIRKYLKKGKKDHASGYAIDSQAGDVPLKPVGCQVIEEAQSAQLHRQRSQSVSVAESREESAREKGNGEGERPK